MDWRVEAAGLVAVAHGGGHHERERVAHLLGGGVRLKGPHVDYGEARRALLRDHAGQPREVKGARGGRRHDGGRRVKRDLHEGDAPAPRRARKGRHGERLQAAEDHHRVVRGDAGLGEDAVQAFDLREVAGAIGHLVRVDGIALVGEVAMHGFHKLARGARLTQEGAVVRLPDGGAQVSGKVPADALAAAHVERAAAQGDPLALLEHLSGGLFLAHRSPLSQSSWPASCATCSNVLFLMSIVRSAADS